MGENERREGELPMEIGNNLTAGIKKFRGSGKLLPSLVSFPSTSWECALNLKTFPNSQRPKIQTIFNFYLGRVIISTNNQKKSLKNNTKLCCTIWILTMKVY